MMLLWFNYGFEQARACPSGGAVEAAVPIGKQRFQVVAQAGKGSNLLFDFVQL
jgi:hypothetical protein